MRVLMVTLTNRSHLYFQVPLAWALRAAGHDVRVAGQPEIVEEISRAGLTAVPVGEVTHGLEQMPDSAPGTASQGDGGAHERQAMPVQEDYARADPLGELHDITWNGYTLFSPAAMIDDLVGFARYWRPDLVIWDAITFAGSIAARACGAPHVRMLFGADAMTQLRNAVRGRSDRPDAPLPSDPLRDWLAPILHRYGCEFGEDVVVGQRAINPMPPWFWRPPGGQYIMMRHIPFNGGAQFPEWLRQPPDRRRVCITLGITSREYLGSEASAADLFEAVDGLDVDVIATLDAKQLGPVSRIPDNVRVVDFVPMDLLVPTCSAVVHHGGGGTFASALQHGVPQLIVPGTFGCIRWWGPIAQANGLQENGAGRFVADADHLTAQALRADLVRVLDDPSFGKSASRLRAELAAAPGPNDVVPVLEKLAAIPEREG